MLLAAAALYLLLGDIGEGALLVGGAILSIGLVVMQETRNERAIAALRALAAPTARVLRAEGERRIPAREIAPRDFILIGEGERVPADAVVLRGDVLAVDESILTGESAPVLKAPCSGAPDMEMDPEPGDPSSVVFSGTMTTRGQATLLALRTGRSTRLGRIGRSLSAIEQGQTPLQIAMRRVVGWLGAAALGFCVLVAVAYWYFRGDWIEAGLAGLTLAISLTPEEFPMVLVVFLALGSWRLARHNVLARRSAVIETLGAVSMLCVDKTGTLTQNSMEVAALAADRTVWRPRLGRRPLKEPCLTLRYAPAPSSRLIRWTAPCTGWRRVPAFRSTHRSRSRPIRCGPIFWPSSTHGARTLARWPPPRARPRRFFTSAACPKPNAPQSWRRSPVSRRRGFAFSP